ncbi:hypothetical protein D3C73_278540 [compost metagenome]
MSKPFNRTFIISVQEAANRAGGYLTAELYNKNRAEGMPSWDTLKQRLGISFDDFLNKCEVKNKSEFLLEANKIKAISNFKILNLEFGEVSKVIYDSEKLLPSSEYITKHFGWKETAEAAGVKLANSQYQSEKELLNELKSSIKKLGYIPTSSEYKSLRLKPTADVMRNHNIEWSLAMKKIGFKPYGKTVKIKDKVCFEDHCYRQFTPSTGNELYCDECFKQMRSRIIKNLDNMSAVRLKQVCEKLIYNGNSQSQLLNIFK